MPELYEVNITLRDGGHIATHMELEAIQEMTREWQSESAFASRYECYGRDWEKGKGDRFPQGFLSLIPISITSILAEKVVLSVE